jgi:hypothetical protein
VSATNRQNKKKDPTELYKTPPWSVLELLNIPEFMALVEQATCLIEPCCGDGVIIKTLYEAGVRKRWIAGDIVERNGKDFGGADVIDLTPNDMVDTVISHGPGALIITNPPFSQAIILALLARQVCRAILLLRNSWLVPPARNWWTRHYMPDINTLPNRPKFLERKHGDATDYGWMVWDQAPGEGKQEGRFKLLSNVPKEQRQSSNGR